MAINRIIDNASVAIASLNRRPVISSREMALKHSRKNGALLFGVSNKLKFDANAAKEAGMPVILLEDGYTEKNTSEIYHNHLIRDFVGIEKIISEYL